VVSSILRPGVCSLCTENRAPVAEEIADDLLVPEDPFELTSSKSSLTHTNTDLTIVPTGSASDPYEPSEDEKALYYYGLRGPPRLVARSSGMRWILDAPRAGRASKKYFETIGNHDLVFK
jgi:hypothetical protein